MSMIGGLNNEENPESKSMVYGATGFNISGLFRDYSNDDRYKLFRARHLW